MTRRDSCLSLPAALVLVPLLAVATAQAQTQSDGTSGPRRVALVIGANEAPPGRRPLRYAHRDARGLARVLERVGGYAPSDIHVLLDPAPHSVLRVLDGELGRLRTSGEETMLLFYYSGHADERSLYPGGEALLLSDLRSRLEDEAAGVRIGILDACRGGGWTGTRGLTEAEAFDVNVPLDLTNEGSVLVASSSGLEDAHESEELQGGFFTHHWIAGLQGAADLNGDRSVTLTEAFDYAKRLTIRDTARHTTTPQHPSFRVNLSGRRDLPLSRLEGPTTTLTLHQDRGPLQLVHLDTGLIVLELPRGGREARLAIDPGRYLIRTLGEDTIRASEVRVRSGRPLSVHESGLESVDEVYLATRGVGGYIPSVNLSTLPAGRTEAQIALGVARNDSVTTFDGRSDPTKAPVGRLVVSHGITDHLQLVLPLPALVFRASFGAFDLLPWAGFHDSRYAAGSLGPGFGFFGEYVDGTQYSAFDVFALTGALGVGLDVAYRFSPQHRLLAGVALRSPFVWSVGVLDDLTWRDEDIAMGIVVGDSFTIADRVTISVALQYEQRLFAGSQPRPSLRLGSVQGFGLRPLPLIRIHINEAVAIDGHVALTYDFVEEGLEEIYMLGGTFFW